MIDYVKVGIFAGLSAIIFGSGWWMGYSRYVEYKKTVEIATKQQEAKVESIQKQHELIKKGIQDEYDAKLRFIKQYYVNGMHNNDSSKLPNISTTTSIIDAKATYFELAGKCAETTLMLIELQKWVNETSSIK